MASKPSNLTTIMIAQHLEDEHWAKWGDKTTLETSREGNCQPLLETLTKRFEDAAIPVKEAYGILHDQDLQELWDPDKQAFEEVLKSPHIHFLFKFEYGATLTKLAEVAGLEPQYLEKAKSGRYGYDNSLAYLIHAKDINKHQYDPTAVVSFKGPNYLDIYKQQKASWERGRAVKNVKEANLNVDWLVEQILEGQVTRGNILLTNDFYKIYGQHKHRINEAFETYGEQKSYKTITALEAKEFKKTILFIAGESGTGKTVLAKELVALIISEAEQINERWECCITAATNAFDEYNGQDILLLDDIRGDSLTASDWLKLLDPYSISPISARYRNRMGAAKVIIITSTRAPDDFFLKSKGSIGEDIGQFIRRIGLLIDLNEDDAILSKPVKNQHYNNEPEDDEGLRHFDYTKLANTHLNSSYIFDEPETIGRQKISQRLLETVITNMRWQTEKTASDTDQSNGKQPKNPTK